MNINGVGDKLTIEENVKALSDNDIIVLSETWLTKQSGKIRINGFKEFNNYRKHLHCNARRASGGMLVYIRDKYKRVIKIVDILCDHFIVIEITDLFDFPVFLIMCYVPPEDTTYVCRSCDNNFCDTLRDLVIKYSSKGSVSVCGDLNAHTALLNDNVSCVDSFTDPSDMINSIPWSIPIPKRASCDHRINNYGRELISLCDISGLRIMNGRCSLDNGIGKPTYIKGNTKSVIDYLLVQEKLYPFINEFSVGDKWPDSDHCPINFSFNVSVPDNKGEDSPSFSDTEKYSRFYWDDELSDEFINCLLDETGCEYLDKFYFSILELESPQAVSEKFNEYITQACDRSLRKSKSVCRTSKFPVNPWFDEECKQAKAQFHKAQKSEAPSDVQDHFAREFKRLKQQKKRKYLSENLSEIMQCKNPKELWAKLNEFKGGAQSFDNPDINLNAFYKHFSKPAIDNTDNCFNFDLSHAAECQELFNKLTAEDKNVYSLGHSSEDDLISHIMNDNITLEEVISAINTMKKGKSPGVDGIPVDIFKYSSAELADNLVILFNYILGTGDYPELWASGIISPVPKTVAPAQVDKFRKVTVLPAVSKIFDVIINTRLEFVENVFKQYDIFNGGFKKGSMCSDNLFILNAIIEKYKSIGKPLYICFVDFKRAFDCVNRMLMFTKLLKSTGECSKVLKVMISMYKKTTCSVKWQGMLSEKFLDTMGVAQGGVTSPYFFKKFLSDLVNHLDNDCGVVIFDHIIKHLLWADDLFLVSPTAPGMQRQLDNLQSYCSQWQLVVNTLKTKILVYGVRTVSTVFTFNGNPIEISSDYTYLGNCVKDSRNPFVKIEDVILHKCYKACYKMREYTEPLGQLTPPLAVHFFNTLVSPILDY